ncbi:substrate-binding domain-containing protein [Nesterenkonia pannonica]|uniref:substrate-binding domain-containing protein n=1 Tax=Nesterenkonia pannonica TaxID=1548602 RepID=UPI00216481E0|nr:substrate-binding domain-containing protein [Nesterenkonia pannonica]
MVTIGRAEGVAARGVVDRAHGGADTSLKHLLEQGARRVLVLQTVERYTVAGAAERYLQQNPHAGHMETQVLHIPVADGVSGGYRATREALQSPSPPDAIYAPIDAFALGAVDAVRQAGLQIPTDVMICTNFDGPRATTSEPPLTALDLHLPEMAETAGQLLLDCLDNPGGQPRVVQAPEPTLRPRESTARRTERVLP